MRSQGDPLRHDPGRVDHVHCVEHDLGCLEAALGHHRTANEERLSLVDHVEAADHQVAGDLCHALHRPVEAEGGRGRRPRRPPSVSGGTVPDRVMVMRDAAAAVAVAVADVVGVVPGVREGKPRQDEDRHGRKQQAMHPLGKSGPDHFFIMTPPPPPNSDIFAPDASSLE